MIIQEDVKQILQEPLPWKDFRDKNILISGAHGFIANYIIQTLKKCDANVYGIVKNITDQDRDFYNCNFFQHDMCDPFDWNADWMLKQKWDYIFHFASIASPKYYLDFPVQVMLPNMIGTFSLLGLATKTNAKFIFASTGIYDCDPILPRSCYIESKRAGEALCMAYSRACSLDIRILRFYHVYGPGIKLDDGRVFADFINNILQKKKIKIKSDGLAIRNFCYVVDAITAIFYAIFNWTDPPLYHIGNDETRISIYTLAQKLSEIYKLKIEVLKHKTKTSLEEAPQEVLFDMKILRHFGWTPKYNIENGFKRTIQYFNEK